MRHICQPPTAPLCEVVVIWGSCGGYVDRRVPAELNLPRESGNLDEVQVLNSDGYLLELWRVRSEELPWLPPIEGDGTRLIVRRVRAGGRLLECVRRGADGGDDRTVLIPRVDHVSPDDNTFGFVWTRRQFPVRPASTMSINMAQGQTLECAGVWLADPCFTHG